MKLASLCAAVSLFSSSSFGQSYADSLAMEDDQIITSIAPYSADMRAAILDVSQYPQALVKLERLQARTSQSFQDLVANYPRQEQEKLYQVSRFPETISQLVITGKGNADRVKPYLKDFPEQLQTEILDVYNNHYDDLVKMDNIYQSSQGTMQLVTEKYPASVQDNFKKILTNPDVMSLLTDHINQTVSLGDAYKSDPKGIMQQLDDTNKQLTDQTDKDLTAYKDAVAKDPKLQDEMKTAADDYSAQTGQNNNIQNNVPNTYYDNYPYPYWFGYPYWYSSPMWYMRPYYYNTGFYYGAGGNMIIVGMPSAGYARWFYHRGYMRYPGLYNHYNTYYNMHRTNIANINVYRGFNSTAHRFYNNRNDRGNNNYSSGGRTQNNSPSMNQTTPRRSDMNNGRTNNSGSGNTQMNQSNTRSGFNNQGLSRYHANTYHGMGWGGSGGRGFNGGGGGRGSGGGGRMGGGGGGGGGHGRGR